jgi:hypothetical protein
MIEPRVIELRSIDPEILINNPWTSDFPEGRPIGIVYPVPNRRYSTYSMKDTTVYIDKCILDEAFEKCYVNEHWTKHIVLFKEEQ